LIKGKGEAGVMQTVVPSPARKKKAVFVDVLRRKSRMTSELFPIPSLVEVIPENIWMMMEIF
jgi:hypothetical protein